MRPLIPNSSTACGAQAWRRLANMARRLQALPKAAVFASSLLAGLALPAAAQNVTVSGTTFPVTTSNVSTKQTLTLTVNTDDVVIQSLGITSSGSSAEYFVYDYGTCAVGTYVSAGTSCTFTVAFYPQTPGYAQSPAPIGRWAQLYLAYTDQVYAANEYVDYPLIGSGSKPTPVLTPGVISDLVGNDLSSNVGFAGDGGPASGAVFSQPGAIAMDGQTIYNNPQGNIYIADTNNAVVRVVYQAGSVPTLNNPVQGNIYTIAGVAPSGSIAHPGPGQDAVIATQSHLSNPTGVAVDPLGNVYIADSGNNAIRMIKAYSAGYIFTVAGTLNAPGGFGGDGGPAASANLSTPSGIAVDGYGNLYIADTGNNSIRVVYQGGAALANLIATEIPGTPAVAGNVYTIAGGPSNALQSQFGDGQLASLANLSAPGAVTVDSSGNLYIADYGNSRVRRVDVVTGLMSTIQQGADNPTSLAVDASDDIYFTGHSYCTVSQYNPSIQTGLALPYVSVVAGNGICSASGDGGGATAATLNVTSGVVVDGQGNLYVLESDGVRVVNVQQSSLNYGTVNISNGGAQSAIVTDENIVPPPGSQTVVDFSNTAFQVANATPQYFSISSFAGVNTNIPDCDFMPVATPYLSPGTSCGVQVTFQPDTDGGPYTGFSFGFGGNIALTGSGTGTLTTATLAGPGTTFAAEPNQGPSAPQIYDLTNTGSTTLHITSISIVNYVGGNNGGFGLSYNCPLVNSEYTLAPGASCAISVTFVATGNGAVSATLQAADNASSGGGIQMATLNATASAPIGAFTNPAGTIASSLTFDPATPGNFTTGTVMLENLGTAPLNLNTAAFGFSGTTPGAFSIASDGCGPQLLSGGSCTIGLKFSPTAFTYGNYSANLVVQDDSGGTPLTGSGAPTYISQTLPLTGATGNPPLQTSSFTLQNGTFLSEPIGSSTTQTATLVLNDASNVVAITAVSGSEFSVGTYAPCSGPMGTTCAVPITFTPSGLGLRTGSLIVVNLESGMDVPYFLPLSGTGTGTLAALTPGIISTYVGGNGYQTTPPVGLDGPAAQAQVGPISGMIMDSVGNMFLSGGNQTIFKVDTSQNIHLYAGTGAGNGMAGDGGPALNASLAYTGAITLNPAGSLYLPTGLYLGDSDAPQFDDPMRIRYIDPSTGVINTVVGYYATFNWYPNFPYQTGMKFQINLNGVQYLFRAEPGGTSSSTEPVWPSTVGQYVIDGSVTWVNEGIYSETKGCPAQIDMLADGCPAQDVLIGTVTGMAFDAHGNLYFAESGLQFDITQSMYQNQPATVEVEVPHSMIRRVDASTGIVSVVAGTGNETTYTNGYNVSSIGIPGYTGDNAAATQAEVNASGLAFDSKGNLYFIQDGAYVRKIDMTTGIVTTVTGAPGAPTGSGYQCAPVSPEGGSALSAQYTLLSGITFDAADNMYLADSNQCVVRRIDAGTQTVHTVAGTSNAGANNLGFGDFGQPNSDGSALEAILSVPYQVQIDGQANIYIASNYNGGVRKVNVSQSILPFAGPYAQTTYSQQPFTVSAPLTATVLNAGNSGPLQFYAPFLSPTWGISSNFFIRDVTDPTGVPDCYDLGTITPGNECPINVDFTPQASSTNFAVAQAGVTDNSANSPQVIELTGVGLGSGPDMTLLPALLTFFTPQNSKSITQTLLLTYVGAMPIQAPTITLTGPGASVFSQTNNCINPLSSGGSCQILVTFDPPFVGGTNPPPDNLKATVNVADGSIILHSQLAGVGTLPAAPIPLSINETIDVSDVANVALVQQLFVNEVISTSDASPTIAVAQQLNINEVIQTSDAAITQVQLTATTTSLQASLSQLPLGAQETLTARVTPSSANGTISFYDGSTLLGSTAVSGGTATYSTSALGFGTHLPQAVYSGSTTYAGSISATTPVLVQAILTITAKNLQRTFGVLNPPFGYSASGFVGTDDQSILGGTPFYNTPAGLNSPGGTYPITISAGSITAPGYYVFQFVAGTLKVITDTPQFITFQPFPGPIGYPLNPADRVLALTATSSSGGLGAPITYQVSGPATISEDHLTIDGPGLISVTASEVGNGTFAPATPVTRSFEVIP